jgi:hypothetical protein
VWRVASTMAAPASLHAVINALAKVACGVIDNGPGEVFDRDADFAVILLDAALAVGKREPRGLVRCTPFHAMYATRGEL